MVARDLYTDGAEAYRAGDYEAALALFEEANAALYHPSTLKAIAECHVRLGDFDAAIAAFERYLADPAAPRPERVRARLEEIRAARDGRPTGESSAAPTSPASGPESR